MSLSLLFLLLGAALLAGGGVMLREGSSVAARTVSTASLAVGCLMFLVGLVNALSGTM